MPDENQTVAEIAAQVELGVDDILVTAEGDKVMILFAQPVAGMRFTPDRARVVGEQMGRCAYEAHFGRPPPNAGSALAEFVKMQGVDQLRPQLIAKATVMIRSMYQKQTAPVLMAQEVVDAVLREVT